MYLWGIYNVSTCHKIGNGTTQKQYATYVLQNHEEKISKMYIYDEKRAECKVERMEGKWNERNDDVHAYCWMPWPVFPLPTWHAPHVYRVRGPAKSHWQPGLKFQFANVGARLGDPTLVSTSVISHEHSDMLLCECASSEMTGSGHPNGWQSRWDVRWWVDDESDNKGRSLNLKFEILSRAYDPKVQYRIIHVLQGNNYYKKIRPYDGCKQLLTDGFNGMYTLIYQPITGSSWSADSMGSYPSKPPI